MRKPTNNWVTCSAACHNYPATDYSWHISRYNYIPRRGVYAPQKGKVIAANGSNTGDRGKSIDFQVGNVVYEMSHFKDIGVKVGATYDEGYLLGIMGDTGKAQGVHLHLVIKVNGRRVPDPDAWLNQKIAESQLITVTTTSAANLRTQPNLAGKVVKTLPKGTKFKSTGLVRGQTVSGINKWHKTAANQYVWSGNCK